MSNSFKFEIYEIIQEIILPFRENKNLCFESKIGDKIFIIDDKIYVPNLYLDVMSALTIDQNFIEKNKNFFKKINDPFNVIRKDTEN